MSWVLSNQTKAKQLERFFQNRKIDYLQPGFCDSAAFLNAETKDPRILEAYANYVETRSYTDTYLMSARRKIEITAEALRRVIEQDGRLGACIDASGMLSRMLDRLGVWNYIAKSCMSTRFEPATNVENMFFYGVDETRLGAPHAIVVAPPFYVVDITAKYQMYPGEQGRFIPPKILLDTFVPAQWSLEDLVAPEIRLRVNSMNIPLLNFMKQKHPNMLEVISKLPPRRFVPASEAEVKLDYILVAASGVIEDLEGMTGYKPCNRLASEIFNEDVLPAISSLT